MAKKRADCPSRNQVLSKCQKLVLVLGDQLNADSAAFDDFDLEKDCVWMAEVREESTHVWTHKARIVMFLAAMRHFRDDLRKRKYSLHYSQLDETGSQGNFAQELATAVQKLSPERLVLVEPGSWRVRENFVRTAKELGIALDIRPDRHFLTTPDEFAAPRERSQTASTGILLSSVAPQVRGPVGRSRSGGRQVEFRF